MSKKNKQQLKKDRAISRNKRNSLRREIDENVTRHRNTNAIHVLFIAGETANMEKILFNISILENNGYLINLPILTDEMLEAMPDKSMKEILLYYFGIEADDIEQISDLNLIVAKNLKIIDKSPSLVEIMVRPYNEYTWYPKTTTSLHGNRIFQNNDLKEFFVAFDNLQDIFAFQDTIAEILIYRAHAKKIDGKGFIDTYAGIPTVFGRLGGKAFNRRYFFDQEMCLWLAEDDEELQAILANEPKEIMELTSGYSSYKKDLTRALKAAKKEEE